MGNLPRPSDLSPAEFVESDATALRPLFPDESWPEFEKLVQHYAFDDGELRLEQILEKA